MNKNISVSVITLTKNDNLGFIRTVCSILNQNFSKRIELLILDGSEKKIFDKNNSLLKQESKKTFPCKEYLIIKLCLTKSLKDLYGGS